MFSFQSKLSRSLSLKSGGSHSQEIEEPHEVVEVPDALDGYIPPEHEKDMEEFKELLIKNELYTAPKEGQKASHDDSVLIRFLRARKYDPHKALAQFRTSESWRAEHSVQTLYHTFPTTEFESSKRFYPRWTGRRDLQGHPIHVYKLASIATPVMQKELSSLPNERRYQRIVALWEFMINFTVNVCSVLPPPARPDTPPRTISSVVTIADLDSVSFGQIWSLRGHLQQASTLTSINYPETLSHTFVVNAPSFFPTVWNWLKGWFDPHTRSKIHILSSPKDPNTVSVLLQHIAASDLPKAYGGEQDWSFEDSPDLDDAAKAVVGDTVPSGPVVFEKDTKTVVLYGQPEEEEEAKEISENGTAIGTVENGGEVKKIGERDGEPTTVEVVPSRTEIAG